jgi:hypothetical protein
MCTDSAPGPVASQRSGALQAKELRWHESTDHDILFECWAVADRLSLHALAAQCEWGLTQLWETESVYMRAALDLTPGALQRIARSLCAGRRAAYEQLQNLLEVNRDPSMFSPSIRAERFDQASSYKVGTAPVETMMLWRMS